MSDQVIWKYELVIAATQDVGTHAGYRVLSVGEQRGQLCLWMLVNPKARRDYCTVDIIGTGNPIEPPTGGQRRFVGTVVLEPFVWHVFERVSIEL